MAKPHNHRAVTKKRETVPYTGPVSIVRVPAAHGGQCHIEHCKCGATRKINVKGNAKELGEWVEPKNYHQGSVWGEDSYTAKGWPKKLSSVRFKEQESIDALESLVGGEFGASKAEVLESLVRRAAKLPKLEPRGIKEKSTEV